MTTTRSPFPKRHEILRQVLNDIHLLTPVSEKPVQVWTLMNETLLLEIGLVHNRTAFLEDRVHDWDWTSKGLRFYGHSGRKGELHDLVIVYER